MIDTSDNDNFISDDNIIDEYINELYNYINYSDSFGYFLNIINSNTFTTKFKSI